MNRHGLLRRLAGPGIAACMALFPPVGALCQAVPAPTQAGWELFKNDRTLAAAESWARAAAQAEPRRGNLGLRDAAFANVLAALAFERAGDERAYACWADSVRLYLEAGYSWKLQREALRERWRNLEQQLAQASAGTQPKLRGDEQMLADFVRRLNVIAYDGPRAGLRERRDEAAEISTITPQYFAGAGRADSDGDVADPQSRYGTATTTGVGEPAAPGVVQIGGRYLAGSGGPAAPQPSDEPASIPVPPPAAANPLADVESTQQLVRGRVMPVDATPAAHASTALAQRATGLPRQFKPVPGQTVALSPAARAAALQAWRYVMANRQSATGLVNGKDSYPVTSLADIAQTMAAYTSALGLQFIEREGFEAEMRQLLGTLRELPLYNRELFNRDYDSRTGRMLDLGARSSEVGSGWSAEDLGRLLLWLRVLGGTAPDLAPATEAVFARLHLSRMVAGGQLYSALNQDGREQVIDDLRLGRQQVTAAALSLWGVVLPAMFGYQDAIMRRVGTLSAPGDRRDGSTISPEVFARGIVELGGIDGCFEAAARGMLDAQHGLAARRKQAVMVADELLDRSPWFVHGALAVGPDEWHVAGFDQLPQSALANFSLKAAYLWAAIDSAEATLAARGVADRLERSERGLYGGRYVDGRTNLALTLDTNASVLLAAYYVQRGSQPMLRVDSPVEHSCPGLIELAR